MLRVRPALGRSLQPEDSREKAPPVMMLGYDTWKKRYGGDPSIIGRVVKLERRRRAGRRCGTARVHVPA